MKWGLSKPLRTSQSKWSKTKCSSSESSIHRNWHRVRAKHLSNSSTPMAKVWVASKQQVANWTKHRWKTSHPNTRNRKTLSSNRWRQRGAASNLANLRNCPALRWLQCSSPKKCHMQTTCCSSRSRFRGWSRVFKANQFSISSPRLSSTLRWSSRQTRNRANLRHLYSRKWCSKRLLRHRLKLKKKKRTIKST